MVFAAKPAGTVFRIPADGIHRARSLAPGSVVLQARGFVEQSRAELRIETGLDRGIRSAKLGGGGAGGQGGNALSGETGPRGDSIGVEDGVSVRAGVGCPFSRMAFMTRWSALKPCPTGLFT